MIDNESAAREFVAERCDATTFASLEVYVEAVKAENQRQNLVSKPSLEHVWQRHIADSAQLLDHVPRETSPWLDLGSGPGLPGVVLAIMRPAVSFVLVESRKKRVEFLQRVVEDLALENVSIEGAKLERIERFDAGVITARAFAPLPRLIELSARFSTEDTLWVLPKGRSAEQDLAELAESDRRLFHVEQSITDREAKIIVGHLAIRKRKRE